GKCTPCRAGVPKMMEILTRITEGKGTMEDLDLLAELGEIITSASLCGLGQTAPNPVLTTIRHFRSEYEAHIRDKKCPAGVCRKLFEYYIVPEKCPGCWRCFRECPQKAIAGVKKQVHVINPALCDRCGVCSDVCKFDAVVKR
ncbi:MAG: NADH-ubiquinone oxidoreductase-F iron-sulfur binding region domain-containing protein, partial [Chloroflexota bacterium]|nr:NADH-ubiquinone oxidoreductase-F iron-sulfur binding region domain-containing protein [Chloroflexota bacterium]